MNENIIKYMINLREKCGLGRGKGSDGGFDPYVYCNPHCEFCDDAYACTIPEFIDKILEMVISELKITLRVKHEPSLTEIQVLRDLIKDWCTEFCLEKQELKIE